MTDADSKELKVQEKQEVTSPAEQTTPGLVFTPENLSKENNFLYQGGWCECWNLDH